VEKGFAIGSGSPWAIGLMEAALANLLQQERAEQVMATLPKDAYGWPAALFLYWLTRGDTRMVVSSAMDSQLAYMAASSVPNVFDVKNEVSIEATQKAK
jgi:hypothetical protein